MKQGLYFMQLLHSDCSSLDSICGSSPRESPTNITTIERRRSRPFSIPGSDRQTKSLFQIRPLTITICLSDGQSACVEFCAKRLVSSHCSKPPGIATRRPVAASPIFSSSCKLQSAILWVYLILLLSYQVSETGVHRQSWGRSSAQAVGTAFDCR